jgi:hypothetical protein
MLVRDRRLGLLIRIHNGTTLPKPPLTSDATSLTLDATSFTPDATFLTSDVMSFTPDATPSSLMSRSPRLSRILVFCSIASSCAQR